MAIDKTTGAYVAPHKKRKKRRSQPAPAPGPHSLQGGMGISTPQPGPHSISGHERRARNRIARRRAAESAARDRVEAAQNALAATRRREPGVDTGESLQDIWRKSDPRTPSGQVRFARAGDIPILSQAVADIGQAIIYSPAGAYMAGKAVAADVRDTATGHPTLKRTGALGKQIAKQTAADLRHPLRHPGYTLLDVLALGSAGAGAGARGAAALGALKEGSGLGRVAGAVARSPAKGGSLLRAPNPGRVEVAPGTYSYLSKNPAVRALQRQRVRALQKRSESRVGGGQLGRNLPETVGHARAKAHRIEQDIARAPAEALKKRARKHTRVEQTAVRAVGEQTPLRARIAAHERDLAAVEGMKPSSVLTRKRLRAKIALLKEAEREGLAVAGKTGALAIAPGTRLAKAYERALASGNRREDIIRELGLMTDEGLRTRRNAPAELVGGEAAGRQGQMYVTYGSRRMRTGPVQAGTSRGMGIPRTPSSVKQPMSGAAFRTGNFRDDALRAAAESELEMQRHKGVLRLRESAVKESVSLEDVAKLPESQRKHFIPVRQKGKPYSAETRDFLETLQGKVDEGVKLTKEEKRLYRERNDAIRDWAFPKYKSELDKAQIAAAAAKGEVRFVDERRLGGLNKPQEPITALGRHLAAGADELNALTQIAVLFFKPAYLTPNLLGQSALTVIQQGFMAPKNLAKATKLWAELGPEERSIIRAGTGLQEGGLARGAQRGGRVAGPVRDTMANAYGKVLDSPFRWPSFVHEARKLGYKTTQDVERLLSDPKAHDDMIEAFQRTRDAMIDYSNLTPFEQKFVRRVVFFYPWVKGSTTYTGRFLRDHPVQAAILGQMGRQGAAKAKADLGDVPFYARGIFKVGGSKERPNVVDPRAAQLFDYPTQITEAVKGITKREGKPTYTLTGFLSPAAQLPGQLLFPHDPLGGYSLPVPEALKRQYVTGLPQTQLIEKLRNPTGADPDVLYPTSRKTAIEKYTIGRVAPHPVNRAELNKRAAEEGRATMSSSQKARVGVFAERQQVFEAAKRYMPGELENGRLPRSLRTAFNRKAEVAALRRRIESDTKPNTLQREQRKYEAEIGLLRKWKIISPAEASDALSWARGATHDELARQRASIQRSRTYFGSAYESMILYAKKALQDKGASFGG